MTNDLNGRIALVTGASRGIGAAIADAIGQAGADVAVNYRRFLERRLREQFDFLGTPVRIALRKK